MQISFYQALSGHLEDSTVRLIDKIYNSGTKVVVFSSDVACIERFDKLLWTYSTGTFIAHDTYKCDYKDLQPVYLTNNIENPGKAEVALLVDNFDLLSWMNEVNRLLVIFDDEKSCESAISIFDTLKNQNKDVAYWVQTINGWERFEK